MPATQGSTITVAHGIADYSKILSVEILVSYTLSNSVPHSYTYAAGYEFNYYVISSGIVITTAPANSATIIGKPVRILVTYEE